MIVIDFEEAVTYEQEQVITEALEAAFVELMPRVKKPFFINVDPCPTLYQDEGIDGDCMCEDDREFTIRIDTGLSLTQMAITAAHEMVHVQQYLSGRMQQIDGNTIRYEGVDYDVNMEYSERPWEIEAHKLEESLKGKVI